MPFPFFGSRRKPRPIRLAPPDLIQVHFGVYFEHTGHASPDDGELKEITTDWLDVHADEPIGEALGDWMDRGLVSFLKFEKNELPAPTDDYLRAFGTGREELRRFEAATHVVMITSHYNLALVPFGLWGALGTARALADRLGGVIFDPLYPRLCTIDSHSEDIPEGLSISVAKHIAVPFSTGHRHGLSWMTTTAMPKFGLPNLELRDVPPDLPDGLLPVMNAVAQGLVESAMSQARAREGDVASLDFGPEMRVGLDLIARAFGTEPVEPEEGVRGWTMVGLRHPRPRRGQERFVQIVPPSHYPASQSEWLYSILSDLLKREDNIVHVPADSQAMQRAHARAIAEMPRIRERFQAGLPPGETLYIKHGFSTGGEGHEYMWVVVGEWSGDKIRGQLASAPQVRADLRTGQSVLLRETDVFDWLLTLPDGSHEGGYTNLVASDEAGQDDDTTSE